MTFVEYVGFYGLARSEGLVLRYLADAYKALRADRAGGGQDRGADRPDRVARRAGPAGRLQPDRRVGAAAQPGRASPAAGRSSGRPPVTGNPRAFRVLVRNALFRRVELAALRRYADLGALDAEDGWDAGAWAEALEPYFDEHDEIGTGPDARGPAMLIIDEQPDHWAVRQIFDDPAGDHDWGISAEVDLAASDEAGAGRRCASPRSASCSRGLSSCTAGSRCPRGRARDRRRWNRRRCRWRPTGPRR